MLLTSVLLTVHRGGSRRAYWLGFALFGWAYLASSQIPAIAARLPTTSGLTYLDSLVPGRSGQFTFKITGAGHTSTASAVQVFTTSPDGISIKNNMDGTIRLWDSATGRILGGSSGLTVYFLRIGHSLLTLLLALFGGSLSRFLHDREGREATPTTDLPSSPEIKSLDE